MQAVYDVITDVINFLGGFMPPWLASWLVWGLLTLMAGAPLLIGAYMWLKGWREKRRKKKEGAPEAPALASSSLVRIWKRFLSQIPREFRRHIVHYQPFVVFGAAGSGKTTLITNHTDWEGQAAKFYSSYSVDNALQIYLGSREVVQEIPSAILDDVSQSARRALTRLWRRLFKKTEPLVIIALNASSLRHLSPDALKRQAQLLRGKINLISRIRRGPVRARLVLTHMDKVEGYLAFSQFLEKQGIPLRIDLGDEGQRGDVRQGLVPYEGYLPLALAELSYKAYMKVLAFMDQAPGLFEYVDILARTLTETEPLSTEPKLTEVYLTAQTSGRAEGGANPFASPSDRLGVRSWRQTHRRIAAGIAAAGLALVLGGFLHDRYLWRSAEGAVDGFDRAPTLGSAAVVQTRLAAIDERLEGELPGGLVPRFYHGAPAEIRKRFGEVILARFARITEDAGEALATFERTARLEHARPAAQLVERAAVWQDPAITAIVGEEAIRGGVQSLEQRLTGIIRAKLIAPVLEAAITGGATEDHVLYLLGILYASRENELGTLVLKRATEAPPLERLPLEVIRMYVEHSSAAWEGTADLPEPPLEVDERPLNDLQPWLAYFIALGDETEEDYLSIGRLRELKKEAGKLLRWLEGDAPDDFAQTVHFLLKRDTPVDLDEVTSGSYLGEPAVRRTVKEVLKTVRRTPHTVPKADDMSLASLLANLRSLTPEEDEEEGERRFVLAGQSFSFDPQHWQRLVAVSRMRSLIKRFVSQEGRRGLFFADDGSSHAAVSLAEGDGAFLFPGEAVVPGTYTLSAFDDEVRSVVESVDELIAETGVDESTREELIGFVAGEVASYASAYAERWKRFYLGFEIDAGSLGALVLTLEEMQRPSSPFGSFIGSVVDNTDFKESDSPYLKAMRRQLKPFAPVVLLTRTTGDKPPIDAYRDILKLLQRSLEDRVPSKEEKEAEPDPFKRALTPLARLSLAILRDERDSYLRLVEKWLDAAGLEDEWRQPFLEPVRQLYVLGLEDLGRYVDESWHRLVLPELVPIVSGFPFNRKASEAASPLDVDKALHPVKGSFWKRFGTYVAPVCTDGGDVWEAATLADAADRFGRPVRPSVKLPPGFEVVTALVRLREGLWDGSGNPQPLELAVYPHVLFFQATGEPAGTLSFLRSGEAAVFGFNQQEAWQRFPWEWWQGYPCQVGVQLEDPDGGDVWYRTRTLGESWWALLRLLTLAEAGVGHSWTWSLTEGGSIYDPIPSARFSFKSDPWELFTFAHLLDADALRKAAASHAESVGGATSEDEDEDEDEDEEGEEEYEDEDEDEYDDEDEDDDEYEDEDDEYEDEDDEYEDEDDEYEDEEYEYE